MKYILYEDECIRKIIQGKSIMWIIKFVIVLEIVKTIKQCYNLLLKHIFTFGIGIGKFDKVYICIEFDINLITDETFNAYICQAISKLYVKLWDLCLEYDTVLTKCFIIPLLGKNLNLTDLLSNMNGVYNKEYEYWLFKHYGDVLKSIMTSKSIGECVLYECSDGEGTNMRDLYDQIKGLLERDSADEVPSDFPIEYVHFDTNTTRFNDTMLYFDSMGMISRCVCDANVSILANAPGHCEYEWNIIKSAALPRHRYVACGGTFDQIHSGHKSLLTQALAITTMELTIGITSDVLLSKKANASSISNEKTRRENVDTFIKEVLHCHKNGRETGTKNTNNSETNSSPYKIDIRTPTLMDSYGPTITNSLMEAIVVSSETIQGAINANKYRVEKGFAPMRIYVIQRGNTATLSSTFLRKCNITS